MTSHVDQKGIEDGKETLEKSDLFFRAFRSSPVLYAMVDAEDDVFIDVNETWLSIFGYAREDVIGRSPDDIELWENPVLRRQMKESVRKDGAVRNFEARLRTRLGEVRDFLISSDIIEIGNKSCFLVASQDITERKLAELQARQESEARELLSNVIGDVDVAFSLFDSSDRLVFCNNYYFEMMEAIQDIVKPGVTFEEMVRTIVSRKPVKNAIGREEEYIKERLHHHLYEDTPFELKRPDGRWIQVTERRMPNGYTFVILIDISELKKTEEQARQAEERLIDAIESIQEGFVLFDKNDDLVLSNSAFRDMYSGMKGKIIPGISFEDLFRVIIGQGIFPEARDREEEFLLELVANHRRGDSSFERKLSDDRWLMVNERRTKRGEIVGIRTDITDLKKREETLNVLSQAIEQSPTSVMITDTDGKIEYVNPKFKETSGYTSRELMGETPRILKSGWTEEETYKKMWDTITAGDIWHGEFLNRKKNGDLYWEHAIITPITSPDGTITQFLGIKEDITERKEAEEELNRQRILFEGVFRDVPDAMILVNLNREIFMCNPGFTRAFGYKTDEIVGQSTRIMYEDQQDYENQGQIRFNLNAGEELSPYIVNYKRKNGEVFPGETVGTAIKDEAGNTLCFVGVMRDITERMGMETALRHSEQRFRDVAEAASDWIWETGPDLRFTYISDQYEKTTGIPSDEPIGKKREQLGTFEDGDENLAGHLQDLEERRPFKDFQCKRIMEDSRVIYLSISGVPMFDPDGTFQGYRGTGTNITARTEAEAKAREAQDRLIDAIESIQEGFVLHDVEGKLVLCNSRYQKMFSMGDEAVKPGATIEDLIRHNVERGIHPAAIGREDEFIKQTLEERSRGKGAIERQLSNGHWIIITDRRTKRGETVGIRADITELKEREEALAKSEELFSKAFHASPAPFAITAPEDGLHFDVNEAWTAMLGYSRQEAIGSTSHEMGIWANPDDRDRFVERVRNEGMVRAFETQLKSKTGEIHDCLVFGEYMETHGETRLLVLAHDITDRMEAERVLRDSEERHRNFAADAAHELRTPLAVLRTNLEVLDDSGAKSTLLQDVDVMTRMVEQLLAVTRLDSLTLLPDEKADLLAIATNVATHLAPITVKEGRSLEVIGAEKPVWIKGNTHVLEQAVRNLIENAIKYSARGTTITIQVTDDAILRVIDRGRGISLEQREEIFKRFQRADRRADGAGLGLAIVQRTVETHHGSIEVSDSPGGGATFTLSFPNLGAAVN